MLDYLANQSSIDKYTKHVHVKMLTFQSFFTTKTIAEKEKVKQAKIDINKTY